MGAVRHFLRVDPESLERKDGKGRSLGTEKGSNRPTWVLTVWHHQIAVEALEGPRQTSILPRLIRVSEPGSRL